MSGGCVTLSPNFARTKPDILLVRASPTVRTSSHVPSDCAEGQTKTAAEKIAEEEAQRTLGGEGKILRVYTFSGGGFDTSMQLGVVHALHTAGYDKPDLVTGVSAGAIAAVALAEVLGAGTGKEPKAKHAAQVSKFREILEAYRDGPFRLLMAQLPDGYERKARQVT